MLWYLNNNFYCLNIVTKQVEVIKLIVALNYYFTQYFFIRVNFDKSTIGLHFFPYIFNTCKIFRKLKINSYIINKLFKL